jgi:predicted nucleotidyltransferase
MKAKRLPNNKLEVEFEDGRDELFLFPYGSFLYGTNHETSDLDVKVVFAPSLEDLVQCRPVSNSRPAVVDDVDVEYIPLQVLINDFFSGQTYALELLHALRVGRVMVNEKTYEANLIKGELLYALEHFTTRSVDKMVGYAISQSQKYGLKTRRYTTLKVFIETFEKLSSVRATSQMINARLLDTPTLISELLKLEHVNSVMIENSAGGSALAPALEVCGKKFPLTNKWSTVLASLRKTLETYGERVKQFDGEAVDWKALMHAIRITEQVLELTTTGKLTFPRPNAEFLLQVRQGKLKLDDVMAYLTEKFNSLDEAVEKSVLPEKTSALEAEFNAWKKEALCGFYDVRL